MTYDMKDFTVDHILEPSATQQAMYDTLGRPVVDAVLEACQEG